MRSAPGERRIALEIPWLRMTRAVGINHVALEVGDLDEALAFDGRIFELTLRGMGLNGLEKRERALSTSCGRKDWPTSKRADRSFSLQTLSVEGERTTEAAAAGHLVRDCRLIPLRTVEDPRGSLTIMEGARDIPFAIERVYHLHGVPNGGRRGGHAHRRLEQVLVAVAGAFEVALDDGAERRRIRLDDPRTGLYIPTGIWREMESFAEGTVCVVLASMPYDDGDYERDYEEFLSWRNR